MFNEITIGPLTLHTYGLMIGLGFLAAYAMCYYRGKKMKMEKSGDILYGIFWCAIIGGLVGTRLLYYIVNCYANSSLSGCHHRNHILSCS